MKEIIKYLLALTLIVFVSATTVQVMTVKPAVPNTVFIKNYDTLRECKEEVLKLSNKGYILKSIDPIPESRYNTGGYVLIMEKY